MPNQEAHGGTPRSVYAAWLAYVALLVGFGSAYWGAPPSTDEGNYYVPAIRVAAEAWPTPNLADYALPNPPLALWLQAFVWHATGSIGWTRSLSTLSALVLAGFVALAARRATRGGDAAPVALAFAYVVCFPALLNDAFVLKHHVFAVCGLVGGAACLRSASASGDGRWRSLGAVMLCLSVACSQACVPFVVYLFARAVVAAWRGEPGASPGHALSLTLPLALLTGFFFLWGGLQPPSYRTLLAEGRLGTLSGASGQLVLGLYVVGLWFLPLARFGRRELTGLVLTLPFAAGVVHLTGGIHERNSFEMIVGPTLSVIRTLARGEYWGAVALFSVGVALGAQFLFGELRERRWTGPLPFVILHLAFMCFVPYRFESYYVYLVSPWLVWDWERLSAALRSPRWATFAAVASLVGVLYTGIKLYRLVVLGVG